MPIYEYQCQECGHELEAIRKISDPPLEECPGCGKPALKKKVSAPSFRLKGGGWYETDFKKSGDRQRNIAGDGKAGSDSKTAGKESAGKSDGGEKPAGGMSEKSTGGAKGDGNSSSSSSPTKNQAA